MTLLFILIFLLLFSHRLIEVSHFKRMKIALCFLLIFQILLLNRDLNNDIDREKWEKIEFNKQVSIDKSGGVVLERCCNMDPGVDDKTYKKIFALTREE